MSVNRRTALAGVLGAAAAPFALPLAAQVTPPPVPLRPPNGPLNVAFIIGEGANVMDLVGPWESMQDVVIPGGASGDFAMPFHLATVSDSTEPFSATGGLKIVPNFRFDDYPGQPNVVVMGAQGQHTPKKIAWIQKVAPQADVVMSVCTGAFLLAKTGLLDGLRATTHHEYYDSFEKQFPKVHLERGPRYVENGKFVSAGGITSGIELALRVVERYFGANTASRSAYYMEYARSPKRPIG